MAQARQWAALLVLVCTGLAALLIWFWLETSPAELPSPFVQRGVRAPTVVAPATFVAAAEPPKLTLAVKPYRHPSGAFGVKYPEGWQIDEAEDSVLFIAPDDVAQYSMTFQQMISPPTDLTMAARNYSQAGWGDLPHFAFENLLIKNGVAFRFEQTLLPEKTPQLIKGQTTVRRLNNLLIWQTWLVRAEASANWRETLVALNDTLVINPPK